MPTGDPKDYNPYGSTHITLGPASGCATTATAATGISYATTTAIPAYISSGGTGSSWYGGGGTTGDIIMTQPVRAPDVIVDGVSMKESIAKIQERLAILVPDPALLEKYESLKELYSQYKMMEALLQEETKK